ncbi:hypothetical protein PG993_008545 [Apiospora rasikravindrae]|uniref:Rhodopsin domain-containing protein n=1 Tax=Apiospora rasikravindrae TaxID=990691 RepID=A0ABR1T0N5_9PEZI
MADDEYALSSEEKVNQETFLVSIRNYGKTIVPCWLLVLTKYQTTTWVVTGISALFLIGRLTVRIVSASKLLLDDYLVIAAWLMLLTSAILWAVKGGVLYWMYDVQYGRRPSTPEFVPAYGTSMPLVFIWSTLFSACLWAVKFSFLVFFRRLGFKVNRKHFWWWFVFAVTACGGIVAIVDLDFSCTLTDIEYIMAECTKKKHVRFQDAGIYTNLAIDLVTDLLILSIPFRMLWNVRIPLRKKVALLGVFSLTIVIMVVAIIRTAFVRGVGVGFGEQIASTEWLFLWSNVEASVALRLY